MQFHEVEITEEMIKEAEKRAAKLGELKNSITRGEGNLTGILGELVAHKVIGGDIKDTRDYDIITPDNVKWDVKTKRSHGVPLEHFECSITDYNTRQKCDRYVFVRILKDYSKGWVIGELPKEEYFKKATFIQQGQLDARNGWRAKCDCWNVLFTDLNEVSDIRKSGSVAASV